jgi:hypothetical protein
MTMSVPPVPFPAGLCISAASARALHLEPFRAQNSLDSGGSIRHH